MSIDPETKQKLRQASANLKARIKARDARNERIGHMWAQVRDVMTMLADEVEGALVDSSNVDSLILRVAQPDRPGEWLPLSFEVRSDRELGALELVQSRPSGPGIRERKYPNEIYLGSVPGGLVEQIAGFLADNLPACAPAI